MNNESVVKALDELLSGYRSNEQNSYFRCFSEDCSVVLHSSHDVFLNKAAFEQAWLKLRDAHGFKVVDCQSSNRHISVMDQFAVVIHDVYTSFLFDGEVVLNADRETVMFRSDANEGQWLVCHEHLSPLPRLDS